MTKFWGYELLSDEDKEHYDKANNTIRDDQATGKNYLTPGPSRLETLFGWNLSLDESIQRLDNTVDGVSQNGSTHLAEVNLNVQLIPYIHNLSQMSDAEINAERYSLKEKNDKSPLEQKKLGAIENYQDAQRRKELVDKQKRHEALITHPGYYRALADSMPTELRKAQAYDLYRDIYGSESNDPLDLNIKIAKYKAFIGDYPNDDFSVSIEFGSYPAYTAEQATTGMKELQKDQVIDMGESVTTNDVIKNSNGLFDLDKVDANVQEIFAENVKRDHQAGKMDAENQFNYAPYHEKFSQGLNLENKVDQEKYDNRVKRFRSMLEQAIINEDNARGDSAINYHYDPRTQNRRYNDMADQIFSSSEGANNIFRITDMEIDQKHAFKGRAVKLSAAAGPVGKSVTFDVSSNRSEKSQKEMEGSYSQSIDFDLDPRTIKSATKNPAQFLKLSGSVSYIGVTALDGRQITEEDFNKAMDNPETIGISFYSWVGGEAAVIDIGGNGKSCWVIVAGAGMGMGGGVSYSYSFTQSIQDRYEKIINGDGTGITIID